MAAALKPNTASFSKKPCGLAAPVFGSAPQRFVPKRATVN